MNFRPTKGKVIWSIVITVLFWIFLIFFSAKLTNLPQFLISFFALHNIMSIFNVGNLYIFLAEFVVLYILFSLFQRKRAVLTNFKPIR
jgi:hypothetical protein